VSAVSDEEREWPSLGIIVPVYNEAEGIEPALQEIVAVARRYPGRSLVITIDDGSTDGSAAILDRLAIELEPLEPLQHERNVGYGGALRTGAERAQALGMEYLAFIDSDLTNPPSDLLKIGELARAGHLYIKASRFIPGGGMTGVPPLRRFMSKSANLTARALFRTPVRDVTNGFRALRTDLFLSLPLREQGFAVIVEELDEVLRRGIEPVEFPSTLSARRQGQRPTAFAYSPSLLMSYMRYPAGALFRRGHRAARQR
jgi:glycosyltransferase involved in cell wall biosynthesis